MLIFNLRPGHHIEDDPKIERSMKRAATMLACGYTEEQCVRVLVADGAATYEAVNSTRAAKILNTITEEADNG